MKLPALTGCVGIVLATAVVLMAGGCSPSPKAAPSSHTAAVSAVVGDFGGGIGDIWFDLERTGVRFVIRGTDPVSWWYASRSIRASRETGRSLVVHFDADKGVIDPKGNSPVFPVTGLEYNDRTMELQSRDPGEDKGYLGSHAERALAKGVGQALAGQGDEAQASLGEALAWRLDNPLKGLALKTRGALVQEQVEGQFVGPDADSDRLLMQSFGDLRQAEQLAPNDTAAAYALGEVLIDLGAYDEALGHYRAIAERWPDEAFWTSIRIASIYRLRGQLQQSLKQLDQLARAATPSGMAYHYHRGWTLVAMGRNEEAVAEFTAGLRSQPDYEGAFDMRACALARLGRLHEALDDDRTAERLYRKLPTSGEEARVRAFELRRLARIQAQLSAAIAAGKPATSQVSCGGWWPWRMVRRERSPVLSASLRLTDKPVYASPLSSPTRSVFSQLKPPSASGSRPKWP